MQKTNFFIALMFIFLPILYLSNTFAEDSTHWRLPEGAKARLGKGDIREIAYSPNGKHLAVAGSIGIWLYDMTTYQEVALWTGYMVPISSIAFSPDGKTIVSGSNDGNVRLWDVNTGKNIQTFKRNARLVWSVCFSPDGNVIASGSADKTIRL